MLQMFFSC